jgi:hypothetical protein
MDRVAALAMTRGNGQRVTLLLTAWAVGHLAMMLCYRDLHLLGLWAYGNAHYFKVVQPVLLMLALALPIGVWDRSLGWREIGVAVVALIGLACWRAELVPGAMAATGTVGDLSRLDRAAIVPGQGSWAAFYSGGHRLEIGGVEFHHNGDFKIYPRAADFLVLPLRRLPAGDAVLVSDPGVRIGTGPAREARQNIVFGLPCLFGLAGHGVCGVAGAPVIP